MPPYCVFFFFFFKAGGLDLASFFFFFSLHSILHPPSSSTSYFTMEQYLTGLEQTLQQVLFSNDSNQIKEVTRTTSRINSYLDICPRKRKSTNQTRAMFDRTRPWKMGARDLFEDQRRPINVSQIGILSPRLYFSYLSLRNIIGYQGFEHPVLCQRRVRPCPRPHHPDLGSEGGNCSKHTTLMSCHHLFARLASRECLPDWIGSTYYDQLINRTDE